LTILEFEGGGGVFHVKQSLKEGWFHVEQCEFSRPAAMFHVEHSKPPRDAKTKRKRKLSSFQGVFHVEHGENTKGALDYQKPTGGLPPFSVSRGT
jgi:hypothetical protein